MSNEQNPLSHSSEYSRHNTFIHKLLKSLSLDNQYVTAIPSFIFLLTSMPLIYCLTHRRYFIRGNGWKQIALREFLFQWSVYNVTRLWIYFIKIIKWLDSYLEYLIRDTYSDEHFRLIFTIHGTFIILHTCVSFVPLLLIVNERLNRPVMRNFMIWIGTPRWQEHTEMGMSGYYLVRPLHTIMPLHRTMASYRTKRSCSADQAQKFSVNTENVSVLRRVKSMQHLTSISSINS